MRAGRIAVAAIAAGIIVWFLWPSEERRIRARLDELADAASTPASETDFERVARLAVLARGLTADAVLDPGDGRRPIRGRDAIAALASRAAPRGPWEVRLEDVVVGLADAGDSARVEATVIARGEEVARPSIDAREVRLDLRRIQGQWLVAGALVVAAIEPPPH